MELKLTLIKDKTEVEKSVMGIDDPLTGSNVKRITQTIMELERKIKGEVEKKIKIVAVPVKKTRKPRKRTARKNNR